MSEISKVKAVATGLALATITGLFFWLWRRLKDNFINTQGNRERRVDAYEIKISPGRKQV